MLGHQRRVFQRAVPGKAADLERAVLGIDVIEHRQAVDIEHMLGVGEAQIHHRHEALAARQDLAIVALFGEHDEGFLHRFRFRVGEGWWLHGCSLIDIRVDGPG